ncbi:hypothetical protein L249_7281 [Ophiocordyceps polyrhachis-furcata BCC 54312]|uniref:Uncharacterized protein n=1 Tax=Ophiocordyceps polyrhachis-furcata BCC 54312 TaxID=1330021 RepID=A0A367LAR3_9HYPO|nr:hypothetical protein L249_7281 [Ophiocordyceps polyrhachis-furcata BCC 54312]
MASPYTTNSLFDVAGLVVVVTGGARGLGRIIAQSIAANGAAAVYLLDVNSEGMATTKNTSSAPDVIHTVTCDVTNKKSLAEATGRVRDEVGYCDVVFANAGVLEANTSCDMEKDVNGSSTKKTTLKSLQEKLWTPSVDDVVHTLTVNVAGVYFTAIAFLNLLDEGNKRRAMTTTTVPQKSQIIVTSSITSFMRGCEGGFSYSASKAAVTHLYKCLSTTLAPFKIRVNALAPGFFPTTMTREMLAGADGDPRREGALSAAFSPLERSGCEEDLAGTALFLVSKAGAYINGNCVILDGGLIGVTPSTY